MLVTVEKWFIKLQKLLLKVVSTSNFVYWTVYVYTVDTVYS